MKYLNWNETTITDFTEAKIGEMYEKGYVFTRIGKGVLQQTRSLRIDLAKFALSSENRRILKKTSDIVLSVNKLPMKDYDYSLGKLAKDFYEKKFGVGVMSAQKIKEMLTDGEKSNFNELLIYSAITPDDTNRANSGNTTENTIKEIGYAICYAAPLFLHYSYPFYDLAKSSKDMGLGMMIKAIEYAKEAGMKYIYLGSLQRPTDVYKLQFSGTEWFDGEKWSDDMGPAKLLLVKTER